MTLRKWGILLLVVAMLAVLAVGCGQKPTPAPQETEQESDEAELDTEEGVTYLDGAYEGVGQGYDGEIVIEVTISGGEIINIDIVDENETEGIGGAAFEELIEQAKEAQGSDIDGVTSATVTTDGFIEALEDALSKAAE